MKKVSISILVLAIMLLSVPNIASATDASYNDRTYHIDELGISFDMPEGYDVITRDTEESSAVLEKYDVEPDKIQKIMHDTNVYLYGYAYDGNRAISICSYSDKYSRDIDNLSDFSISDLSSTLEDSTVNGYYEEKDATLSNQIGFDNIDISRTIETYRDSTYISTTAIYDSTPRIVEYDTVFEGKYIQIGINDLSGEGFTNYEYLDLIPILMSMVYEQPEEPLQKASAMPSQETLTPLPTKAVDNTYFIDYLGITVSFPDNYVVITRDMEESKEALEALDVTPDAAKSAMFSNGSYLDATNMDTFSGILVTSMSDEFSAQLGNLSNYSVSEINNMLEGKSKDSIEALNNIAEGLVAPGQDVKLDTSAVNINGIPFFKYVVTVNSEYVPTIMYRTVLDGKYINFQTSPLNLEDGLQDSDIEGLMYVMEHLTFPSATLPPKESTDVESIINRINESESEMTASSPPLPTYSPVPKTPVTATPSFWSEYLTGISKYIIALIVVNVIVWPIVIHNRNKKKKKKDPGPPFLDIIDTSDGKSNSTESSSPSDSNDEDKTTKS